MEELATVLTTLLVLFALLGAGLTGVAVKRGLWDPHHPKTVSPRPTR